MRLWVLPAEVPRTAEIRLDRGRRHVGLLGVPITTPPTRARPSVVSGSYDKR